MKNNSFESVGWRLDRLERENLFLKRVFVCFLLLTCTMIVMGQARPNRVLEADAFLLKDAAGRVRARLSMEAEGRPTLTYLDENGNLVAAFGGGDAPFLVLNKNGSNEQVQLGANKEFVGLGIYDKGIRAGLSIQKGSPSLDLYDVDGKERVSLDVIPEGLGLALSDAHGKLRLALTAPADSPSLGLFDADGTVTVMMSSNAAKPRLDLSDAQGFRTSIGVTDLITPATGETHSTSAASVILFDKQKNVIWKVP